MADLQDIIEKYLQKKYRYSCNNLLDCYHVFEVDKEDFDTVCPNCGHTSRLTAIIHPVMPAYQEPTNE